MSLDFLRDARQGYAAILASDGVERVKMIVGLTSVLTPFVAERSISTSRVASERRDRDARRRPHGVEQISGKRIKVGVKARHGFGDSTMTWVRTFHYRSNNDGASPAQRGSKYPP
jgi:hypothetical protein